MNGEVVKQKTMMNYAMYYGMILGAFWGLKYFLKSYETVWSPMIYIFYILNIVTFFMIYIFYYKYRDHEQGVMQSSWKCISFVILLCLCASVIENVAIFIHIKFWAPYYYEANYVHITRGVIDAITNNSEIKETLSYLLLNKIAPLVINSVKAILLGSFIGVFFALMIGKRKLNQ